MKNLTTYERRQMIVRILEEQSGIKVTELAEQLNVSEGTIRNDRCKSLRPDVSTGEPLS